MAGNRFISIRAKLIISSTVMIVMIVLLIELCVYVVVARFQTDDAQALNVELVYSMGRSIDEMNEAVKRGLNAITIKAPFQNELTAPVYTVDELNTSNRRLKELMTDEVIFLDEIEGLYLFNTDQQLRTYFRKKFVQGEPFVLFPQMDKSLFSQVGNVTGRMLDGKLVYMRTILSMKNLAPLGYLMMVYDDALLKSRISSILPDQERYLAVYDAYGNIVMHNFADPSLLEETVASLDPDAPGQSQIVRTPQHGDMLVAQYVSRENQWRTVSTVAVRHVTRSSSLIQWIVMAIGVLGVLVWFGMQWLLAQKIIGPLKDLARSVERINEGDYSMRVTAHTRDELAVLTQSFNHMLERTDTLVNQVLRDEIRYKEMQMVALRAQINPHLLHNTLECINWLAVLGRKDDICKVTIAFSKLMKSLMNGPRDVSIREEMHNIRSFLLIYQILLGRRMSYRVSVEEACQEARIPALLIQPIVENAVVHGIKKSLRDGHVRIGVTVAEGGGVDISISDNGIGTPEEMVRAINRYSELADPADGQLLGTGYRNVIDRLHMLRGSRLSIASDSEWGTVVDLYIAGGEPGGESHENGRDSR